MRFRSLLSRHQHWATRSFHEFLQQHATQKFQWGVCDCALFAADAIQSFTGVDIAADFRGKYSDEAGAFALIHELTGGTSVADAAAYCAQKHGLPEWPVALHARRGDLVVIQDAGRLIAGVVHLNGRHVVSIGEKGLMRLDLLKIVRAWHV